MWLWHWTCVMHACSLKNMGSSIACFFAGLIMTIPPQIFCNLQLPFFMFCWNPETQSWNVCGAILISVWRENKLPALDPIPFCEIISETKVEMAILFFTFSKNKWWSAFFWTMRLLLLLMRFLPTQRAGQLAGREDFSVKIWSAQYHGQGRMKETYILTPRILLSYCSAATTIFRTTM